MRPRITIAALVAVIASFGVGFAALRSPSQLWASTLFTLTLALLAVALVNVIVGRDRRRAFWAGALAFGGGYFVLALGPWLSEEVGSRLVTTAVLDIAYPRVAPGPGLPPGAGMGGLVGLGLPPGTQFTVRGRWAAWTEPEEGLFARTPVGHILLLSPEPFRRIGHCLFTLLFAALGGLYALRLVAGRAASATAGTTR